MHGPSDNDRPHSHSGKLYLFPEEQGLPPSHMGPHHGPAGRPVTHPPISHNTPALKPVVQARRWGTHVHWGDTPTTAPARASFQLEEPRSQCSAASPPRTPQTARQYTCAAEGDHGQAGDKHCALWAVQMCADVCRRRPRPVSTRHESHVSCPAEGGVRSIFSFTHRGASLTRTPIPGIRRATACRAAVRRVRSPGDASSPTSLPENWRAAHARTD